MEATEERWYEAELYRLRGDFALSGSSRDESRADEDYSTAKRIAQQQGSRLLELRATTSLSRLWYGKGRRAEARDLLAPVYGWFTEGFGTPDLKEAKALLEELSQEAVTRHDR